MRFQFKLLSTKIHLRGVQLNPFQIQKKLTPKRDNISAKTSVGNESLGALDGKSELSQMLENDQREVKIQEQNLKELKKKLHIAELSHR